MASCEEVTLVGHKWPWRLIVMDRKVPAKRKRKTRQKRNPLRVAITLSWSTHTHYKDTGSVTYKAEFVTAVVEWTWLGWGNSMIAVVGLTLSLGQGWIQPACLGGAVSVIFGDHVSLRVHYYKRGEVYFTTLLWQNNKLQNRLISQMLFSELYKIMVIKLRS